jgi:hypothetical protein
METILTRLSSSNKLGCGACSDDDGAPLGQDPSRASSFGWGSFAVQTARENGRTGLDKSARVGVS